MAGRSSKKKSSSVKVYGTKGGVLVIGLSAAQVRKAARLLDRCKGRVNATDARSKTALKFFDVAERFFKSGGRFKRPYKRKKK